LEKYHDDHAEGQRGQFELHGKVEHAVEEVNSWKCVATLGNEEEEWPQELFD